MNWQQLKDFANSLNDEQLKQEVKGWEGDRTFEVVNIDFTEEDMYWCGITYSPQSFFDDRNEDCEDKTDILPKGTIRINIYELCNH